MREYLSPKGRINRGKYFVATLVMSIIGWVAGDLVEYTESIAMMLTGLAGLLFLTYINICVTIKRAHDLDKGWTYILLFLVPIFNIYVFFKFLIEKGTDGDNYYGEDPLIVSAR